MTLIEVLVSLVLLGSVLVSLLLAGVRSRHQTTEAERRLEAVDAMDSMLGQWWQDKQKLPQSSAGEVDGSKQLRWKTTTITNPQLEPLHAKIFRLEVFDERSPQITSAVAHVDLIISEEKSDARER